MKISRVIITSSLVAVLLISVWAGYEYITFKNLLNECAQNFAKEAAVIKLTLAKGMTQNAQDQLISTISGIQGVESVKLTTSNQALEEFTRRHANDPFVQESLSDLKTNPLPATVTVTHSLDQSPDDIVAQIKNTAISQNIIIEYIEALAKENNLTAATIAKSIPFRLYLRNKLTGQGSSFLVECSHK